MRHMTLLDAFNAAAGFTNQTLGILTKEKEYELDAEIYQRSLELNDKINQLVIDYTATNPADPNGKNLYQQDPQAYLSHIEQVIGQWRTDAKKKGNDSQYYLRRLDELEKQGKLSMTQRYTAAAVENQEQKVTVATSKTMTAIENNAGLNSVDTFTAGYEFLQKGKDVNEANRLGFHNSVKNLANTALDKALKLDVGSMTTAQVKALMTERVTGLEKAAEKLGENIDMYLDDKPKKMERAIKSGIEAVQERNLRAGDDLQFELEKAARKAKETGSQADIKTVYDLQADMIRLRDQALKSTEYSRDDNPKIRQWGQLPAGLDPNKDKDKGGDIVSIATVRTNMERIIDDQLAGKMPGVTGHNLEPQMLDILYKEAWERGNYRKNKDAFAYEFSPALNEYFKIYEERYNNDPARKETTAIVKDWFKHNARDDAWLKTNYPEYGEYFARQLLSFHFDTIASLDYSTATGEIVLESVKDFMATLRGEGLDMITRKNADYSKPSNLAKALTQRDANTNIMYTTVDGRTETMPGPQNDIERVQRNLNEINKVSASWLEQAFDLEKGRLIPINKQPDSFDIDAETYFQYGDTGAFYRAKGNSDGSITLQKAEGLGGQWGSDKTISNKDVEKSGFNPIEFVKGLGRRFFGASELRDAASAHAGRVGETNRLTEQLANALGTDGKPFPVPDFKETDTSSLYYFDRHRTALEKYIKDNGAERYLQWLRENHADILPEAWKK